MKSAIQGAAAAALSLATFGVAYGAAITTGNLVVVVAGDGAASLSSPATSVSLRELTVLGSTVQTIAMPTAASGGNFPLTISGSSVEGLLRRSTNGNYLTLGGYGAAPGTAAIASTTSDVVPRVVGRVEVSSGNVDTTTALNNAHSGSNIRSAVSTDGTNFWTGGGGSTTAPMQAGVVYSTLGATTGTRVNGSPNGGSTRRAVGIFNGQLYVSGSTTGGPNFAINSVGTGTPTSSAAETNLPGFPTTATHSTYDFWFADSDTVYLADDSTAANGGGIQRWDLVAGSWTNTYTLLNNGATATGVRGLTGYVDTNGNAVLYATTAGTSQNLIVTVTDAGVDVDTATTVATATTNTGFRGIVYMAEVPEPTSLSVLCLAGAFAGKRRRLLTTA